MNELLASFLKIANKCLPTVLIVYLEPDVSSLAARALKDHSINAITCDRISNALTLLESNYSEIGLVLTDLMFVDGSAERLFKALKETDKYRHIVPLLFSVRFFLEEAFENFKELGVVEHITIPFSGKELVNIVRSYLKID